MEIDQEQLQEVIKTAVQEALEQYFSKQKDKEASPPKDQPAQEADGMPSYKDMFHRIMEKVARGELKEEEAGRLLAEINAAFGGGANAGKAGPASGEDTTEEEEPVYNTLAGKMLQWEKELADFPGKAAESTLAMMERMREKIEKEVAESDLYREMKVIREEEAKKKADADLQAMKDRLSKDK